MVPIIIWVLVGVLLFAAILSIGFKTTLKDFFKSKLVQTTICFILAIGGFLLCALCLKELIDNPYGTPQKTVVSEAVGAATSGIIACVSILVYHYKIKGSNKH